MLQQKEGETKKGEAQHPRTRGIQHIPPLKKEAKDIPNMMGERKSSITTIQQA